jgi:hypothetical protein
LSAIAILPLTTNAEATKAGPRTMEANRAAATRPAEAGCCASKAMQAAPAGTCPVTGAQAQCPMGAKAAAQKSGCCGSK